MSHINLTILSYLYFRFTTESKSNSTDPETILARIKVLASDSEEKSEDIANKFFDSSLTTDEFLEQFKASRTEMHLRKLKAEKMQELLRQGAHQGVLNPLPTTTGYPGNFYGGGMPYPNMPAYPSMPMPPLRPPY